MPDRSVPLRMTRKARKQNSPSLLGNDGLPALGLGRDLSSPCDSKAFWCDKSALSLQFLQNHPAFPHLAGRDGFAFDFQHSHLVAGFSRLSRHLPIGGGSLSLDPRERVSAEERHFLPGLSLRADFGGHTSRRADAGPPSLPQLCRAGCLASSWMKKGTPRRQRPFFNLSSGGLSLAVLDSAFATEFH